MAHLSIALLGPFQATLKGAPVTGFASDKVRALLAYLAVESDAPQRREKLAGLLWPDWPERTARTNLRRALANLRQVIDDPQASPPFLLITRQTIQFNAASDAYVDVTAFTNLLGTAIRPNQPANQQTIQQLEAMVELYRGSFLEGFSLTDSVAFEDWALFKREQLQRQALATLQRLAEHHERSDDYERALRYA